MRELSVSGKYALDIVQALATEDMAAGVLPELTLLRLHRLEGREPAVIEAAEQFVAARKLSGRTIRLSL